MLIKKILVLYIALQAVCAYAQETTASIDRFDFLYDVYLQEGQTHVEEVKASLKTLESQFSTPFNSTQNDDVYILYMRYTQLLSAYHTDGVEDVYGALDYSFSIATEIVENSVFSAKVLLAYADFRASTLPWTENEFLLLRELPTMYRRVALHSGDDTDVSSEVKTKLILYATNLADAESHNRNTFIEKNKLGIEDLSKADRFMGYIALSFYYMKKHDIENGWKYLSMAQEIYPNNKRIERITKNYAQGEFSW